MCRKLLFCGCFMDYKNSFDNFCQEGPHMLHSKFGANRSNRLGGVRKSRFFVVCNFMNGKLLWKWVWPTSHNSAQFCEHVDMRFEKVWHVMWDLWAKNAFALKMAPPAGHFWCVSYGGQSIPPLWKCCGVGTVPNISLDCHQSAT